MYIGIYIYIVRPMDGMDLVTPWMNNKNSKLWGAMATSRACWRQLVTEIFGYPSMYPQKDTVDGRNPAPVDR